MNASLRDLLIAASELIDPNHQGVCWTDPVAWDGRPLHEQARDIQTLLDAEGTKDAEKLSDAISYELDSQKSQQSSSPTK